jgi:hypothetical protein
MKIATSSIALIACLFACSYSLAATNVNNGKFYKWTDAKGQTHYGEHPPINVPAEVIKPQTGHSDPTPAQLADGKAAAGDKPVLAKENNKDKTLCEAASKSIHVLTTTARVRMKDDKGEFYYLDDAQRQEQLDQATKLKNENCD